MGNATSSTDPDANDDDNHSVDDHTDELDPFDGIDTLGYRVLGVQPNSPAASAGLVSFFDFLVGADGQMLLGSGESLEPGQEYDDVDIPALLEKNIGKPIEFLVWNIKTRLARLVEITPRNNWGGEGLLGVIFRMDNYGGAEERLVRVLSIESTKSPASIAGLVPEKDFLLGTTQVNFDNVDRLAAVLYQYEDRNIELYVYNTDEDRVRIVTLLPTPNWEGSRGGLLGAEVGTGYLHRLPSSSQNTEGKSDERKVRYATPDHKQGIPQNSNENQGDASNNHNNNNNEKLEPKILQMEPQLEMEPEDGEGSGLPRTHLSPSALGRSQSDINQTPATSNEETNIISNSAEIIPDTTPTTGSNIAPSVHTNGGVSQEQPYQIFTPTSHATARPPSAPLSGDGMGSVRSIGSKYPPSSAVPTSASTVRSNNSVNQSPYYHQAESQVAQAPPVAPSFISLPTPPTNVSAIFSQPPPPSLPTPPINVNNAVSTPSTQTNFDSPPKYISLPSTPQPYNAPQQFHAQQDPSQHQPYYTTQSYGATTTALPPSPYGSIPPQQPPSQYGSIPPQQPYGSSPPSQPYGSIPPTQPYSSIPPTQPYSSIPPTQPYSSMPPTQPYGSMPPTQPYGSIPPTQPYSSPYSLSQSPQMNAHSSPNREYNTIKS